MSFTDYKNYSLKYCYFIHDGNIFKFGCIAFLKLEILKINKFYEIKLNFWNILKIMLC